MQSHSLRQKIDTKAIGLKSLVDQMEFSNSGEEIKLNFIEYGREKSALYWSDIAIDEIYMVLSIN